MENEEKDYHLENLFRPCFAMISASRFPQYGLFENYVTSERIKYMNVDSNLKDYGIPKNQEFYVPLFAEEEFEAWKNITFPKF